MDEAQGIKIVDVRYAFGPKPALVDVTVALRTGHFTALLGPNGAGKTTLVSLLSALFVPQGGRISIFGVDLARDPLSALSVMGIVFQQQTLDLDLSVRQNMAYFAALHGLAGRQAGQRIDACLARLGLAARQAEKVRTLNGGHRRRLEIARALLHEPRFLLLDEPTVGLDIPARADLVAHVHALCRDDGLTVLWATHLVDEVAPEDDLVVLHQGAVRAQGAVADVLAACGARDVLGAFQNLTAPAPAEAVS
ncbi:MAG TPA: ABC transporter ATP-binding protein [Kiloniellales bacterium]|jgi:ABC-2 type transport system ATP-binding protein